MQMYEELGLFDDWNVFKKSLAFSYTKVFVKERDIFFIKMGKNIGFEQDGKGKNFARPVVVLKVFNTEVFWGIPLTTKNKDGKYYFSFLMSGKKRVAILSQLRLYSTRRVLDKIGYISKKEFFLLKQKIKALL